MCNILKKLPRYPPSPLRDNAVLFLAKISPPPPSLSPIMRRSCIILSKDYTPSLLWDCAVFWPPNKDSLMYEKNCNQSNAQYRHSIHLTAIPRTPNRSTQILWRHRRTYSKRFMENIIQLQSTVSNYIMFHKKLLMSNGTHSDQGLRV